MQLKAGYILQGLPEFFLGSEKQNVLQLVHHLSYFDLDTEQVLLPDKNVHSIVYLLNRLVSRGAPAYAPVFIEDILANTFLKTRKKVLDDGSFTYEVANDDLKEELYRALHIIDPRVTTDELKQIYTFDNDPEAQYKKRLVFEIIPQQIGQYILPLLDFNREISTISRKLDSSNTYNNKNLGILGQKLDIVLELPYVDNFQKGLAIEIEKKIYSEQEPELLERKNQILKDENWAAVHYLRQLDFENGQPDISPLVEFSYSEYFDLVRRNYERPLYRTELGKVAMQLALTPFEAARIQKTILMYILSGKLSLDDEVWNIAVIERDVPGAFLGLQELKNSFEHLSVLSGAQLHFPEINFTLYYDETFADSDLHSLFIGELLPLDEYDQTQEFDLLIDSSLLRFKGLDVEQLPTKAKNFARLRSIKFIDKIREIPLAKSIEYKPFYPIKKDDDKAKKKLFKQRREALNYFARNLLRFQQLTKEQFKFLSKALSLNNTVIDASSKLRKTKLLQLSAMLQPGINIIVAPTPVELLQLKSAFSRIAVDTVVLIEGIFKDGQTYRLEEQKFLNFETNLVLASAEQFHLPRFRNLIKAVKYKDAAFSYLLIDEIQSASPWSHTYNLAYAGLPSRVDFLSVKDQNAVVLGFTSTASYDVQFDLQHVFNIDKDNWVKFLPDFSNLKFKLHRLGEDKLLTTKEVEKLQLEQVRDEYILKKELAGEKTLIYSNNPQELADKLQSYDNSVKVGWFYCHPQTQLFTYDPSKSFEIAEVFSKFRENEIDTLIAGRKIELGLDKSDVRRLVLQDLPLSFDDFIHLISRVGRDGEPSEVHVIANRASVHVEDKGYMISGDILTQVKEVKDLPFDIYLQHRVLKSLEKTMRKDLMLADELLNNMSYLNETLVDSWRSRIMLKFGIWTKIEAQPPTEPKQLYVYDHEDLLGYLDLKNRQLFNQAPWSKKEQAEQVLSFLESEINQLVSNPMDIFLILDKILGSESGSGIVQRLATLEEEESTTMNVEFYNNNFSKILEMLPGEHDLKLPELIYWYNNTANFDQFYAKLIELTGNKRALRRINFELAVEYDKLRNFRETYRLIAFLQIVGVVVDYTLNYTTQQFVIVIRKLSDESYLNNVYKYVLRYVSRKKALEVYEKVPRYPGQTILEKSVNYIISFYHTYIVGKRFESLYRLEHLVDLLENNREDLLLKLLNNYFSANMIVDLETKQSTGESDWYKLQNYFMQKIGFLIDNWLHFDKSTTLVLEQDSQNFVFLFLKGLASLLLSDNDSQKSNEALDYLAKAFSLWIKHRRPSAEEISQKLQMFYKDLERHNYELRAKIEKVFELKIFTAWLEEFNKKFIDISLEPSKNK